MEEYLLLIRNSTDIQKSSSPEYFNQFLKACQFYVGEIKNAGKLISAQPLERKGIVISTVEGDFKESPIDETGDIQVGYYHITAEGMDEAIEIAKHNPEFAFSSTSSIEIRPIKAREQTTGFVYPQ